MFISIKNYLIKALEFEQNIKAEAESLLQRTEHFGNKRLIGYHKSGKVYYTILETHNKTTKRNYIGANSDKEPEISIIRERHVLKELLKKIENNIRVLQYAIDNYESINPNDFRETLPIVYQEIPASVFKLTDTVDSTKYDQPFSNDHSKRWHPDSLKYRTSSGFLVRSKNELLATLLFDKMGIAYVYEESIEVNGKNRYVDFKLISPRGSKVLYIEIFGMMDHHEYRINSASKLYDYVAGSYTPGVDILFIFCNSDESIDIVDLERFLVKWIQGEAVA